MPGAQIVLRILRQARRRWTADRCSQVASSLAFQTSLALVPLLAVAFALLKATGQLEARSQLLRFIAEMLLPTAAEARDEIIHRLSGFSESIAAGALGSTGLLITIAMGFLLFLNVESVWNAIWGARQRRPLLSRFLLFYAAVTLLPFMIGISVWRTAALLAHVGGALNLLLSLALTTLMFTVANRVMPTVRVTWRAALIGGLTSAVLFEAAKFGFSLYLAAIIGSYRSIYGALAILPLFLFWIFLGWLIVLLGVELAHAAQRLPALEAAEDAPEETCLVLAPHLAVRLLGDVARHFATGQKAMPAALLQERHHLPERAVRLIFERLAQAGLVIGVEDEAYLPARPLKSIRLDEIVQAVQAPGPAGPARGRLDALLLEVDEKARQQLGAATLEDVI